MDVGAVQDPVLVGDGPEDAARLLDLLEHLAIRPTADPLRGKEASPPAPPALNVGARLLEPIAAEVRLRWHSAIPEGEQLVHIRIPQLPA